MEPEKKGVKESLELIKAVEILGVAGVEIAKGGLGADDLPKALELVKKADAIIDGFKGVDQVDDEFKDLDQEELVKLGLAAYGMVKNIVKATKKEVVA